MGQLADALSFAGRRVEERLVAHGPEMSREGLDTILPQSWRFETEAESAVLRITADHHVSVSSDVIEAPQVIVKWDHASLVDALLAGRSNEQPRASPPKIRFTSGAGRKAFSLLGTSLNL